MSLLSYQEIIDHVVFCGVVVRLDAAGRRVEIDFNDINSTSLDLHMGNFVLQETPPIHDGVVDFRARTPLHMNRVELDPERGFILAPGQFLLAETAEVFDFPLDMSGEYKMKSSMARIGLEHLNSGWCGAGWHGSVLTLEFKNLSSHHSIRLRPGDAIGQMVFFRHTPVPHDRSYAARGRYNRHNTVESIKE